ncbi:hypothetical protein HCBG_06669 [Histoplasma capsulatum G186AR]|uniref:Uncharacterized protein n=1 Tax=Ajellomyces capsulatus (strain G186AR / H82 / ATCC MYA-2454 / RMSCC 2432) TaxID=447093 RepID=C0NUQ5_AJECG|nr:uncharacterized protein HCBG_06669 [Histoplasma capsulatum G186AR]EEH04718.1 hypothetical protein HCBG_06669 [Histoplasma capsulatum G186AR]
MSLVSPGVAPVGNEMSPVRLIATDNWSLLRQLMTFVQDARCQMPNVREGGDVKTQFRQWNRILKTLTLGPGSCRARLPWRLADWTRLRRSQRHKIEMEYSD